jgi:surface antigen
VRASANATKTPAAHAGVFGRQSDFQRKEFDMIRAGLSLLAVVALCAANVTVAYADPPPWAPAHGWRAKHDHHEHERVYVMPWRSVAPAPYGIAQGTCYRETLGAVIGGGTGAAIGSQIGKGTGRLVAVAGGAILGFLAGGAIGRSMDEVDQNCIGQALEHADDGRQIRWRNPDNNEQYTVSPVSTYRADDGRYCREYTTTAQVAGKRQQVYGTACRQPDGSWQIVG